MRNAFSRVLLGLCSLVLALGAFAHARAFPRASRAIASANIAAMYGNDFRALWLADSTTLFTVAILCALVAIRPAATSKSLLTLIALIPAATAVFIYTFVGNFYAGHLLLGAAVACAVAARS